MKDKRPNMEEEIVTYAELKVRQKVNNIYSIQAELGDKFRIRTCQDKEEINCKTCFYEAKCPISVFKERAF